ncbi:MAG: hypothetical protein NTV70_07460 [Acidobacteria bacterium]|nr:hypothetical protein [Acidobacteriota bacterium]
MIDSLVMKWRRFWDVAVRASMSVGQAVAILMSTVMVGQPLMAQASDPPLVTVSPVITVTGTINITLPQDVSFDNAPLVPANYIPPFAAGPIIISGGDPNICPDLPSNRIIRNCNLGRSNFEKTIVNSWLAMRGLPESAAALIYQFGRSDLRDELRSYMSTFIKGAIMKEPAQRTADETAVVNWLQEAVRQNEIAFFQAAADEYNRFNSNSCRFTLEPTIARALDLTFDNVSYCFPSIGGLFASRPVPNANYFRQVGLKKAYSDKITAFADGSDRLLETQRRAVIALASLSTFATVVTLSALAAIAFGSLALSVSAFVGFGIAAGASLSALLTGAFLAFAGPAAIVLVAVLSGVTAAISLASDVQNQRDINALLAGRATAANPPDLAAMLKDSLGNQKIEQTFQLATLPEAASTVPLPAADGGTPFYVSQLVGPTGPAASFNYTAFDKGGNFNLQVQSYQRNWFLQTGTDTKGSPVTRFSRTLEFFQPTVDSDPSKDIFFTAYLIAGGRFVVSRDPKSSDISCPADPITGLSPTPLDPKCGSYVTNTIRMRQGTSNVVQLRIPQAPVFVGVDTALFTVGGNRTFFPQLDSTSAGLPCSLSSAGSLPAGVTFSSNGFRGTATATGVFPVVVTANCGGTTSTRNYTIRAEEGFRFVWPTASTTINLVRGRLTQFTIQTNAAQPDMLDYFRTGEPFPTGMEPQGFNPDGTVTVKGKPTGLPASIGKFNMFYTPIAGGPTSIIDLIPKYNLVPPTLPTVAANTTVDWASGIASSHTFDGTAANVQVRWSPVSGLPSWATFTDLGNNTARITGTPPPVTSVQEFPVVYRYVADGDDQPSLRQFTLRIRVQPNSPVLSTTPPLYFRLGDPGRGRGVERYLDRPEGSATGADGNTQP